jgi:hypothetical protein
MSNPNASPIDAAIDAETAFVASLSPEQRELMGAYENRMNDLAFEQVGRTVDGIIAHFPGLAPAVRAIASIAHGDLAGGNCACWPKSSPADATPAWPDNGQGDLAIDERLELLAGLVNHLPAQRAVLLALADHIASSGQDWPRCCGDLYPTLNLTLL